MEYFSSAHTFVLTSLTSFFSFQMVEKMGNKKEMERRKNVEKGKTRVRPGKEEKREKGETIVKQGTMPNLFPLNYLCKLNIP